MEDTSKKVPGALSEAQVKGYLLPGNLGNNDVRTSQGPGYSKPMAPRRTVAGNTTGVPNNSFSLFDWLQSAIPFSPGISSGAASNGLYNDAGTIKAGGALVENTSVTEDGFDYSADKEESFDFLGNPYGPVTSYYKSELSTSPLPDDFPEDQLVRKMGMIDPNGDAEIGVFGNGYNESIAYVKTGIGAEKTISYFYGSDIMLRRESTSGDAQFYVSGNTTRLKAAAKLDLYSNVQETLLTNAVSGAECKYTEVPIEETIAPGASYSYFKGLGNDTYTKIDFEGTYIEGGKTGFGTIETHGGVGKKGVSAALAVTSTEDVRFTAGMSSVTTSIIVSGTNAAEWKIVNNSIEDNIKVSGIIRIFDRTTTVS